jgi:uncharacterized protein YecE (DUF72 family)
MVFVGTSGFFYREWRGIFYPEGLPPNRWLSFYDKKARMLSFLKER